ncbi:MAG: HAMP domain-containing histidine kinase, partial [Proteobacteria bacterium]|nr:HAMP domain-containing histidine kinase [Pseudomonadota bacterium]
AEIGVWGRDMGFDVGCDESPEAVHTATLDFGFGELILNLFELKPGLIASQVSNLKKGFFAIVGVVFVAVMLAQVSLWRSAREQIRLARKKDDFISAVSHELRTPLTTIRMHTEMLEKGWIKNEAQRDEYYATMRQESERLSRLIENVLDFSRIQRGSKKYNFQMGDINECVSDVIDMMGPCASQAGFAVEKDFGQVPQFAFDADAVMQIVINLMDNAIKYAWDAAEKFICVRTRCENGYVLIEVEDHGPGVPRLQRQKVFDEFYRCGDESRRETTGTGLGLALVKRFAQAHNGFVEILTAKPTGAIFRVGLVAQEA